MLVKRLLAITRLHNLVAGLLEVQAHELDDIAFVIDDKDGLHAASIPAYGQPLLAANVSAV